MPARPEVEDGLELRRFSDGGGLEFLMQVSNASILE